MQLAYLDFDFSDEDTGRGTFDTMASVPADRLPALLAEITAVLRWASGTFGPAGAREDAGEWDYELQGVMEPDTPLRLTYRAGSNDLTLDPAHPTGRVTLTFTLSGSSAFCEAFRECFEPAG